MNYRLYVYKKKTNINFKIPDESKGDQHNKVLEKSRNQKKGVPVNQPILILTYAGFFIASGIFQIM